MKRRLFRENVIKLIYQDILGGDYQENEYDQEVEKTFLDVKANYPKLDEIINSSLTNWSIDRLNYVDLAIIRFSVYELTELKTPFEIVVNEALEITKIYSNLDDDLARKFNNRLLENIKKTLNKNG